MSIAALPDPIYASAEGIGPVLVLGWITNENVGFQVDALGVDGDGVLRVFRLEQINIDTRYDYKRQEWVSVGFGGVDATAPETPDDGGEEIPGYIPEPDGTGDGYQGPGRDEDIGRVDPGETG